MRVVSALRLFLSLSLVSVTWTSVHVHAAAIRVASIGDYGSNSKGEEAVAKLVADWKPDLIITSGDNNYYLGLESSIDTNIGKYYASYIGNYQGKHGEKTAAAAANTNRFFPSPGNHDWLNIFAGKKGRLSAYTDYFTLPGNERYYDFIAGPIHFFALDSDGNEPDGNTVNSVQANWLKQKLANSTSRWKIAYFHHPPYSSGYHQSALNMRWPFEEFGITAIIAGHDHLYERINPPTSTIPYFVNGFGGALQGYFGRYGSIVEGSMVRYNLEHGAMFIEADEKKCIFTTKTTYGDVIDRYVQGEGQPMMMKENPPRSLLTGRTATLSTSSLPMLWNGNILNNFKSDWKAKDYNDGGWSKGISPLGYGSRLAWGTDIGNNHGNRWFRYHFTLTNTDLASIGTSVVQLRVLSDDGADVYLNGQLVDGNANGGHKLEYWNRYVTIDKNLLIAGDNVFAAFLKNTIFTMSGGFDLDLVILTPSGSISFPAPQPGPLGIEPNPSNRSFSNIPDFGDLPIRLASMLGTAPAVSILTGKDTIEGKGAGAVWKYIAKNDMLDPSWSSLSYDDSTWQSGASPLGYNHINNTEPIPFATTLPTQATYYYFRYTFFVNSSTYASWSYANQLQYRLAASEGADLYINGVVIDEDISQQHPLLYWNRQEEFSSQLFNVGTNVIAIVVKSTGATAATGMDFDIANLLPYAPVVENGNTIPVKNAAVTVTMPIPIIPTVIVSIITLLLSNLM